MSFSEFMAKVRYLDNRMAKWMMRHFYILFFEIFLVMIFLGLFANTLKVIDVAGNIPSKDVMGTLLMTQTTNSLMIVLLMLLNSFWILYMFNSMLRFRSLLKEISYNTSKFRRPAGNDQNLGGKQRA